MSASVDDYRIARHSQLLRLERFAHTTDRSRGDVQGFFSEAGDGGFGREVPLTFQRWIVQTAQAAPSPADSAAAEKVEIAALQDAHAEAERLRELYEAACATTRTLAVALVNGGASAASVGTVIGVTRQRVAEIVKKGRRP